MNKEIDIAVFCRFICYNRFCIKKQTHSYLKQSRLNLILGRSGIWDDGNETMAVAAFYHGIR